MNPPPLEGLSPQIIQPSNYGPEVDRVERRRWETEHKAGDLGETGAERDGLIDVRGEWREGKKRSTISHRFQRQHVIKHFPLR